MEDIAQGLTKDANPAHEFDLNKSAEENEDQTNVVEYSLLFNLSGFSNIDLNKFPEDDYENDNYEEKEKKKLLNTLRQTCFVLKLLKFCFKLEPLKFCFHLNCLICLRYGTNSIVSYYHTSRKSVMKLLVLLK
ncbi:hypothetical protein QL285_067112 [Trifolium repens]|nr:hypothetical protein QL285_067112 [Trifolium repens]